MCKEMSLDITTDVAMGREKRHKWAAVRIAQQFNCVAVVGLARINKLPLSSEYDSPGGPVQVPLCEQWFVANNSTQIRPTRPQP